MLDIYVQEVERKILLKVHELIFLTQTKILKTIQSFFTGDSGGPLFNEVEVQISNKATKIFYYQQGLVSFGLKLNPTAEIRGPAIYTRIDFYIDWILANIES
jgi:secreted trypsin-like serine protease